MPHLLFDTLILALAYVFTLGWQRLRIQALHPTTYIFIPLIALWGIALFDDSFLLYAGDRATRTIAAFCGFVALGHFSGALFFKQKGAPAWRSVSELQPTLLFNWAMLGILGILLYDFATNVWPDVFTYTLTIRQKLMEGEVTQPFLYRFFQPLFTIYASVIVLSRSIRKPYRVLALLLTAALLFDFLKVDKGTLKVLAVAMIAYLYTMDRIKTAFALLALFFVGFVAITFLRTAEQNLFAITVQHLYDDTVGNVFSFYWSIAEPFPVEYQHTFPEAARILGFDVRVGGNVDDFYLADVGSVYNTFPAMSYIYADFGLVGICVAGLAFGLFNQFAVFKAVRKEHWLIALPIISSGYLFLFRGFAFGALGVWLAIGLCILFPSLLFTRVGVPRAGQHGIRIRNGVRPA